MADKTAQIHDKLNDEDINLRLHDNGDSSYSQDTYNATVGKTDDAAVTSDTNGTISGKLRGLVKIFADLWDTTNHALKVTLVTTISGILNGVENDSVLYLVARRIDAFQDGVDVASDTAAQLTKAAVTSKSIYITDISISTDTSQSVKLQDNASTPEVLIKRKFLPANSVWSKHYTNPIKVASGKQVNVVCGGVTGNVTVDLQGYAI